MKKKTMAGIGAAVTLVLVSVLGLTSVLGGQQVDGVSFTTLKKEELKSSIGAKGVVKSTEYANVYSTLNYAVKSIEVKAGDTVTEGQVLCVLDTEDLELNIAQQKAELDQSQKNSLNALQNSERIYNETLSGIGEGSNSQILNAQNSVRTTEINLANAQRNYDDKLREYNEGTNAQVVNAASALESAELDRDTKKSSFEKNEILYAAGAVTKNDYEQSKTAYLSAENKYLDAVTSLANAEKTLKSDLEQLQNSLKTAQANYDNAVASENAAIIAANNDAAKQKNSVNSSEISLNADAKIIAIQRLEKQLQDSTVRAAMSGTVTAVYAKVGSQGTGLLFVIENTDDLKITANLKEYDMGKVSVGMSVTIKSDATGEAVYDGIITRIAPTAAKNNSGETVAATDAEFEVEIAVTSENTGLRIGMNTRLSIILDKKESAFFVPYDAVAVNGNGGSVIYVIEESGNGKHRASEIAVSTGLETDFYVEIAGDALAEGMKVINDTSKVTNGMDITVN